MTDRLIHSISFTPDGIDVTFMGPADIRADGMIFQSHSLSVSRDEESVQDEIEALEGAAANLLQAALSTWSKTPPVPPANARSGATLFDDNEDD